MKPSSWCEFNNLSDNKKQKVDTYYESSNYD